MNTRWGKTQATTAKEGELKGRQKSGQLAVGTGREAKNAQGGGATSSQHAAGGKKGNSKKQGGIQ